MKASASGPNSTPCSARSAVGCRSQGAGRPLAALAATFPAFAAAACIAAVLLFLLQASAAAPPPPLPPPEPQPPRRLLAGTSAVTPLPGCGVTSATCSAAPRSAFGDACDTTRAGLPGRPAAPPPCRRRPGLPGQEPAAPECAAAGPGRLPPPSPFAASPPPTTRAACSITGAPRQGVSLAASADAASSKTSARDQRVAAPPTRRASVTWFGVVSVRRFRRSNWRQCPSVASATPQGSAPLPEDSLIFLAANLAGGDARGPRQLLEDPFG